VTYEATVQREKEAIERAKKMLDDQYWVANEKNLKNVRDARNSRVVRERLTLLYCAYKKNKEKNSLLGEKLLKKKLMRIETTKTTEIEIPLDHVKPQSRYDTFLAFREESGQKILIIQSKETIVCCVCVYPHKRYEKLIFRVRSEKNPWKEDKISCATPKIAQISSPFTQKMRAYELSKQLFNNLYYDENLELNWKSMSLVESLLLAGVSADTELDRRFEAEDYDPLEPTPEELARQEEHKKYLEQMEAEREAEEILRKEQEYQTFLQNQADEFYYRKSLVFIQRILKMVRSNRLSIKKKSTKDEQFVLHKFLKLNTGKLSHNLPYLTLQQPLDDSDPYYEPELAHRSAVVLTSRHKEKITIALSV
jgi:hypothetical protein